MHCEVISLSLSLLISSSFVIFMYIFAYSHDRDNPITIKRRLLCVTVSSILSTFTLYFYNWIKLDSFFFFEMSSNHLVYNLIIPLLITAILFLGPMVAAVMEKNLEKDETLLLIKFRNYLFSPVLEEYVFRFQLGSLLINCFSINQSIFISSLLFALCHFHHYFSRPSEISSDDDLHASIFQILYTFLYGCYASFFFFKCNSLLTPILLHAFCNFMTFPDFKSLFASSLYKTATLFGLLIWSVSFFLYIYSL